uniref:Uncharacterized protein n=1 Tax=Cacopsylla melanoneura TaxID=428564 RepID=A0A8D8TZP5_9HEMI
MGKFNEILCEPHLVRVLQIFRTLILCSWRISSFYGGSILMYFRLSVIVQAVQRLLSDSKVMLQVYTFCGSILYSLSEWSGYLLLKFRIFYSEKELNGTTNWRIDLLLFLVYRVYLPRIYIHIIFNSVAGI